jgi:hypothetical protein
MFGVEFAWKRFANEKFTLKSLSYINQEMCRMVMADADEDPFEDLNDMGDICVHEFFSVKALP